MLRDAGVLRRYKPSKVEEEKDDDEVGKDLGVER